jgi:hypothetical protein
MEGLRPSFSAHVRWREHGAPIESGDPSKLCFGLQMRGHLALLGGLRRLRLVVQGVDHFTRLGVAQNDPRLVLDGGGI